MVGRDVRRLPHPVAEPRLLVDDLHAPARPGRRRGAPAPGSRASSAIPRGLVGGARRAVGRLLEADLPEEVGEALAVLRPVDRVRRRPEDPDARPLERHRELERRLPAELDDHPERLLLLDDVEDVLEGQGLEVEPVRGVVVGRDRLRVAVDHDRLDARLAEREGGVHARVVELDPLPDPVRPRPQDHHLRARGRRRLVLVLVGRVEVGRVRHELRRARVHHLEGGADAVGQPRRADLGLGAARQLGRAAGRRSPGASPGAASRARGRGPAGRPPRTRPAPPSGRGTRDRSRSGRRSPRARARAASPPRGRGGGRGSGPAAGPGASRGPAAAGRARARPGPARASGPPSGAPP